MFADNNDNTGTRFHIHTMVKWMALFTIELLLASGLVLSVNILTALIKIVTLMKIDIEKVAQYLRVLSNMSTSRDVLGVYMWSSIIIFASTMITAMWICTLFIILCLICPLLATALFDTNTTPLTPCH